MATSVVESLVKHVEGCSSSYYRVWSKNGSTPRAIVDDLRSVAEDYNEDIEEDHLDFGGFVLSLIDGLSSDEVFELGSELLSMKEKYKKLYG